MKQRAFTLVELLIVITIMAILLTLAVVNLRSTQPKARDSERIADVQNLSIALEGFYSNGPGDGQFKNSYPGTIDIETEALQEYLTDHLGRGSLHAPGVELDGPDSLETATSNNQQPSQVAPAPTTDTYVYQPLNRDGDLCDEYATSRCTSFNIFYQLELETDDCPGESCVLRSKHS